MADSAVPPALTAAPTAPSPCTQQLRDAQYALAAADCAQLALMLAVRRGRAGRGRAGREGGQRARPPRQPPLAAAARPLALPAFRPLWPLSHAVPPPPCHPQNERLRAAAYADTLSALQMEHVAAGDGGGDGRAGSIAAAVERVRAARRGGAPRVHRAAGAVLARQTRPAAPATCLPS